MGHGIITMNSRLRIANRAANRCRSLFATTHGTGKQVGGAAGRTRGVPRNSKGLLETCTGKRWSRNRERTRRERSSEIGSAALRPLHARCFLLRRPLPFIARKGAVCIQFFTNRIQPPRSLHVPTSSLYASWRACVCRAGSRALVLQFLSWTVFFTTTYHVKCNIFGLIGHI